MQEHSRPNPDSLLDLVQHDRSVSSRGRLKVFFGASAGVGKTYAMLLEARRRLAEGIDVVIGIVETHGRSETAGLVNGIPALPPRDVLHRGVTLHEFDLEAALERKPSLILMDELAHTNAPGSRHPKRWQDVVELLNRGTDVYTTLNVQHLESINDMVARLTGIVVRETVPDTIFDAADEISLIDIPSDELLQRLHDGKVYIAEGANTRAAESFFKKTNLVALRELALRRTAERVDAENDVLNAAQGMKEAQLGQKILVCVGHDALGGRVIRHAKRMATRAKAPWVALYVETGRHDRLSEKAKLMADRNLRLAEKMGASVLHRTGSNAADEILNYAQHHGFTHIVVGHRHQPRGLRWLRGALSAELIERGAGLEITTVTDDTPPEKSYINFWQHHFARPSSYLLALGVVGIATLLGLPFRDVTDSDNLTMIYLTAIMLIAAWLGTGPSIMASLLSVGMFNYFFTEPYYTFEFYDKGYYFTFTVMLVTSLIIGSLTAKLSLQTRQARRRETETSTLYALTRELSSVRGLENMADVAIKHITEAFRMEAVVFLPQQNDLQLIPAHSAARELKEESVARWVIENGQIAGRGTDTLHSARGIYVPLAAEKEILGVLGLLPAEETYAFTSAEIRQLETFATLIASAFQRASRASDAELAKVESASEKLRNVLLSSVSHDLRTPLASITGAASSALMLKEKLPKEATELLISIHGQAARLAKLVTNLLDATSLESGTVQLNKQPYFIQEVIGSALSRIAENKGGRILQVTIAPDMPLINMDGLLIEQVLVNLLENAIRYTAEDGRIIITGQRDADALRIRISDNGEGVPAGDEEKIFEKFYTQGHRTEGNAGLGLAICRGIVTAHGGMIFAKNNKGGGASFTFTLPGLSATLPVHE